MDSYALQQHVEELLSRHKARSFPTVWQNQKLWIKQHEAKSATFLPLLTRLLKKLSSNPLYYPSAEPKHCLKREATRLTLLKSRGVRVPQVVLSHDNYLVLTDLGPSVKFFLTDANISMLEKQHILMAAAAALAQLHQQNRWHGRPALRDICWDGEHIGFIDFEEDPHQHLSIDQCMARDVLIFVHGLYRYLPANDPAILLTISEYQRLAPGRVWREAIQIAEKMWLAYPCLLTLRTVLGKDGRQAFLALRQLRRFNNPRRSPLSIILLSVIMAFMLADQFD